MVLDPISAFLTALGAYRVQDVVGPATVDHDPGKNFLACDISGGDVTVNLSPAAVLNYGFELVIKRLGAGTGKVIIKLAGSDLYEGAPAAPVLGNPGQWERITALGPRGWVAT